MTNTARFVRRAVYIWAGLLGVFSLVLTLVLSPSAQGPTTDAWPTPGPARSWASRPSVRAFEVESPVLTIYDLGGQEQDWNWLTDTFGAVTVARGSGAAHVAVLRAIEGPTALVIHVETATGTPVEGIPVVFNWPDAPYLAPEQQACGLDRGIVGYTNGNGDVGFGMGGGAYYFPPSGGPHAVWLAMAGTDCLGGLGMLGGTNHIHLDSVWRLSSLTVDTPIDSNAPEYQQCTMALDDCSLRGAISAANAQPGMDHTIFLPAGTYSLDLAGVGEDANASGDLDITTNHLVLAGAEAASTIIDGNQLDRLLHVHTGATVELEMITLRNGRTADGDSQSAGDGLAGGGVYNAGTLILSQSVVTGNRTGRGSGLGVSHGGDGGGVYNAGTLTLNGTTVSANTTGDGDGVDSDADPPSGGRGGDGGGIYNAGTLTLNGVVVHTNATGRGAAGGDNAPGSNYGGRGGAGGGIYNAGTATLTGTVVMTNTTGQGGDRAGGTDVTCYGGPGGSGAGIYNSGTLALQGGAVSDNATGGGGHAAGLGDAHGGSGGLGGGVYNAGSMTVDDNQLSGNVTGAGGNGSAQSGYGGSGGSGGGIYTAGTLTLDGARVAGNRTGSGGAGRGGTTVRGGHAGSGAGIYNDASVTVQASAFEGNTTGPGGAADCDPASCDAMGGDGGDGGGLYIASGRSLSLEASRVSSNTTGWGGSVVAADSNPGADGDGGGLYSQESSPYLHDVVLRGNSAAGNGAGLYCQGGSPNLVDVTFLENTLGTGRGAGMVNDQGEPLLIDVAFWENTLETGAGAGLFNAGGGPLLINVIFAGNQVRGAGDGGGLYSQGGNPRMVNALFSGNWAGAYGGGIYTLESSLVMTNTTLSGNTAQGGRGSGLFNEGATVPVVRNSILWGNAGGPQIDWQSAAPDIQYSNVQSATVRMTNIDSDPDFVRAPDPGDGDWMTLTDNDYGDLRLQVTSPAIDAADNTAVPADQLDLDGDGDTTEPLPISLGGAIRFAEIATVPDSGNGAPPVSDMGAYEQCTTFYMPLAMQHFEP
jgi:hypothetical protein